MKKTIVLLIMIFGIATSLSARSAMENIDIYTEYFEKAVVAHDTPNIAKYGLSLAELIATGKLSEPVDGQPENKYHALATIEATPPGKGGFRKTAANADESLRIYRAIGALAIAEYIGRSDGKLKAIGDLIHGVLVPKNSISDAVKRLQLPEGSDAAQISRHLQLVQDHYLESVQTATASTLYALYNLSIGDVDKQLDSPYSGIIIVQELNPFQEEDGNLTFRHLDQNYKWLSNIIVPDKGWQKKQGRYFSVGRVSYSNYNIKEWLLEEKEEQEAKAPANVAASGKPSVDPAVEEFDKAKAEIIDSMLGPAPVAGSKNYDDELAVRQAFQGYDVQEFAKQLILRIWMSGGDEAYDLRLQDAFKKLNDLPAGKAAITAVLDKSAPQPNQHGMDIRELIGYSYKEVAKGIQDRIDTSRIYKAVSEIANQYRLNINVKENDLKSFAQRLLKLELKNLDSEKPELDDANETRERQTEPLGILEAFKALSQSALGREAIESALRQVEVGQSRAYDLYTGTKGWNMYQNAIAWMQKSYNDRVAANKKKVSHIG